MSNGGMDLDDPAWARLLGGYGVPYDVRGTLRALENGQDVQAAWQELWTELYHHGDVGEASYAAVPQLVRIHLARGVADWNSYALVATIEEARRNDRNPSLPASLQPAYEAAWHELIELALRDLRVADEPLLVSSILAVLAIGKRQFSLGRMALLFDEDERRNILAKAGWP